MNLINFLNGLLSCNKKIDKKILPSQGLFYVDNLEISIKKADDVDIKEYERDFVSDNLSLIIFKVKRIVQKNIILTSNFTFEDLKSIDVVFIFLEIVKFTKSKKILIDYIDDEDGLTKNIEFDWKYFNYFRLDEFIMSFYNYDLKCFEIDGYKFSLPAIGIENCLTNFLIHKLSLDKSRPYGEYFYDFTYFLLHKKELSFNEIENLIQIFNEDIDDDEFHKIKKIIKLFLPMQKYSLIKEDKVIDINSRINLENIWK